MNHIHAIERTLRAPVPRGPGGPAIRARSLPSDDRGCSDAAAVPARAQRLQRVSGAGCLHRGDVLRHGERSCAGVYAVLRAMRAQPVHHYDLVTFETSSGRAEVGEKPFPVRVAAAFLDDHHRGRLSSGHRQRLRGVGHRHRLRGVVVLAKCVPESLAQVVDCLT